MSDDTAPTPSGPGRAPDLGAPAPAQGPLAPPWSSWAPPSSGPASTLPLYVPPPPPAAAPGRRSPVKVVGLVVGVMALLGATLFAVSALDQPDGSASPEAAVRQLFDAISHRDALGVIEALPANERDVLRQPAVDITQELQRLGILSSFSLDSIPGAQLTVQNLQLTTDDVAPGVVRVNVVGGTISGHSIPSELPIGSHLHAILQKDFPGSTPPARPPSRGRPGRPAPGVGPVKDGGGWHVSLGYTIANAIHGDSAGKPDFAAAPAPVGSATPDGAVRDLVAAATAVNLRKWSPSWLPTRIGPCTTTPRSSCPPTAPPRRPRRSR